MFLTNLALHLDMDSGTPTLNNIARPDCTYRRADLIDDQRPRVEVQVLLVGNSTSTYLVLNLLPCFIPQDRSWNDL